MKKLYGVLLIMFALLVGTACNKEVVETTQGEQIAPYMKEDILEAAQAFSIQNKHELTERLAFSPDGKTAYFSTRIDEKWKILESSFKDGKWSEPELVSFSSDFDENGPAISPDGKQLFFSSTRPLEGTNAKQDLDIWVVNKTANGWSEPSRLDDSVNTVNNEMSPSVDKNGTLFFNRETIRENNYPLVEILVANPENGGYQQAELLNHEINIGLPAYHPYIEPNGTYLIFSWPRKGHDQGSFNLYISFNSGGKWTTPQPLGNRVNVEETDEMGPMISPEGKYLFFLRKETYFINPNITQSEIYQLDVTNMITSVEESNEVVDIIDKYENNEFPTVSRKPRQVDTKYGTYYEIFVRSFADSNEDGIGDIKGIINNLDYISELGVDGLWLMPINSSPSYHKYDVTDYYNIDPEYGNLDDFQTLLDEAEKRGIKVIMDLVINHTSANHPWFMDAVSSEDSKYRDYYKWIVKNQKGYDINARTEWDSPTWHQVGSYFYYGTFYRGMPDLNFNNPAVREEITNIAKFWLEKGVDGFRLDAARHIYDTHEYSDTTDISGKNVEWWETFGAACEEVNPDVYIVGEVWDRPEVVAPYYKAFDSTFNFAISDNLIEILNAGEDSTLDGFSLSLANSYQTYTKVEANYLDAPFISNHDKERIVTSLHGDLEKAKLAANIYLTLPGNPFIYYGEELGYVGTKPDELIREPFIWNKDKTAPTTSWEPIRQNENISSLQEQKQDPNSMFNHYKQLIHLRSSHDALVKGNFEVVETNSDKLIAYRRNYHDDSILVVHNISNETQTLQNSFNNDNHILFNSKEGSSLTNNSIVLEPLSTIIIGK
ncbi:DUF3459 domain-containing protein [Bacillus sp. HMF5848]|uniref:alpha-amylase family glycosyl hydrolase n=1 Tax=Bacillus sp. HMF5848 TaxID=2495421 RepID=UPI000F7B58BE|nr:alpha-amylase family glycosyl hydrolase [Bacillus sp. HMF5848]RSK27172.1 DUF3459 domain-containing protein [Bacillus sp. HMF5848]